MANSYARKEIISCKDCGKEFDFEIWLIVDAQERLDLVESIKGGTLYNFQCPHCRKDLNIDAPLLLYFPFQEPHLVFSPQESATQEQNREILDVLIETLSQDLQEGWQDAWTEGLISLPKRTIPILLNEGFSAIHEIFTKEIRQVQINEQEFLVLSTLFFEMINTDGWQATRVFIEQNPLLLSDKVKVILEPYIRQALEENGQTLARIIRYHLALLNHIRKVGIDQAFDEVTTQNSDNVKIPVKISSLIKKTMELYQQYGQSHDLQGLKQMIDNWQTILEHPLLRDQIKPAVLINLSLSLREHYRRLKNHDDLNRAIDYLQKAVDLTPEDYPDRPDRLNKLGNSLEERYMCLENLDDLNRAIYYLQKAVDVTPEGHSDRPSRLNSLGLYLWERHQRINNLDDLNRAIDYLQKVVDLTPEGHSDRTDRLNSLGNSLGERYMCLENLEDLNRSIAHLQKVLDLTPEEHPDRPDRLNKLGRFLFEHYMRLENLDDLNRAIDYLQKAVDLTPESHPDRPSRFNSLGLYLWERDQRIKNLDDLNCAIDYLQQAVDLTPEGHLDRPDRVNSLGRSLFDRYLRLKNFDDLNRAIDYLQKVVDITPEGHSDRPSRVNSLGRFLFERYMRLENLGDLNSAIDYLQQAVDLTPEGHPDRVVRLNSLGVSLWEHYLQLWNLDDLNRAIDYMQKAVDLTPESHLALTIFLKHLGRSLRNHYLRLGNLDDLNRAINYLQKAVDLTPEGHPDQPDRLDNLGVSLRERYLRLENLADLNRAIDYLQKAVDLTPEGDPDRARRLNNLGTSLLDRYRRLENFDVLNHAIDYLQKAVHLTPEGDPYAPEQVNNLGVSLFDRYQRLENLDDFNHAMDYLQQAVDLTPEGHPDRPVWLNNLGMQLSDRYRHLMNPDDLNRAINYMQKAVDLTPEGHPNRPLYLSNLGDIFYEIEEYQKARDAYEKMTEGIETLRSASTLKSDRLKMISDRATAFARLVTCCLLDGDTKEAFRYMEAGKSRVLMETLQAEQINLEEATSQGPDLNKKLIEARNLRADIDWLIEQISQTFNQDDGQQRHITIPRGQLEAQMQKDLQAEQALWQQIERDFPAFAITVSPPSFTLDQAAALANYENATLISYYQHDQGWVASVVNQGKFHIIAVPGVSNLLEKMKNLDEDWGKIGLSTYYLLKEAYQCLITPLQEYLPPAGSRLILAPFGKLHLFPLFAALNPQNNRYLSEEYRLSIIPSLGTLHAMHLEAQIHTEVSSCTNELLAVVYPGSENPGDQMYLPGVILEAKLISGLFTSVKNLSLSDATPQNVLTEAGNSRLIHLGCHGWFDPAIPENSGLKLYGGWLTARQVMTSLNLSNSQLVVLGACLSGKQQVSSGNELTGLITAFIAARARAVVGSLWSVNDAATAYLMVSFYQHVQAGFPLDQALAQAQADVRSHPRWKHPYYWAAFFISGRVDNLYEEEQAAIPVEIPQSVYDDIQITITNRGNSMKKQEKSNPNKILHDVKVIMEQVNNFPEMVKDNLSQADLESFYDLIALFKEKFDSAADFPSEFINAAHQFLTAIESKPAFIQLFCEDYSEEDIKAQQEMRQRAFVNLPKEIIDDDNLNEKDLILNYFTAFYEYIQQAKMGIENKESTENDDTKSK